MRSIFWNFILNSFYLSAVIFCGGVSAQNYQPFNSSASTFFEKDLYSEKDVFAFRADSTSVESADSIFYNYPKFRETGDLNCPVKLTSSWLGPKIIIANDGWSYLFNQSTDTIKINLNAQFNEAWRVMEIDSSNSFIEGKVTLLSQQSVLGVTDSLKQISLQYKDSLGNVQPHIINGNEFILSKNHGLTKLLDIFKFPTDTFSYRLVGLSNLQDTLGIHIPTWTEIFAEVNVGDEFHYYKTKTYISGGSAGNWKKVKSVIGKTVQNGTLNLTFSVLGRYTGEEGFFYIDHNEMVTENASELFSQHVPGSDSLHLKISEEFGGQYPLIFKNDPQVSVLSDSCFIYDNQGGTTNTYMTGLGIYRINSYSPQQSPFTEEEELVYYKSGSTEWGEPWEDWEVSSIEEPLSNTFVSIFPNPVFKGQLNVFIRSDQNISAKVLLYDNIGRNQYEKAVDVHRDFYLQISKRDANLTAGIYFLTVEMGSEFYHRKVVVY